MKIYHNGKRIDRDYLGRYTSGFVKMSTVVIVAFALVLIGVSYVTGAHRAEPVMFQKAEIEFKEREAAKVLALQNEVLETLSGCETRDIKERDATIILDTNNKMSIGRYQFQITTVQWYYKKLFNKEINRVEAIQIAVDEERATELARAIIFDSTGGIHNWVNCARKHNLVEKVTIIKTYFK